MFYLRNYIVFLTSGTLHHVACTQFLQSLLLSYFKQREGFGMPIMEGVDSSAWLFSIVSEVLSVLFLRFYLFKEISTVDHLFRSRGKGEYPQCPVSGITGS